MLATRRRVIHHDLGAVPLHPLLAAWEGAQLVVRVQVEQVFPNCPRYIPTMQLEEESPYAPRAGHAPPRPGWKDAPSFRDALPKKDLRP